MLSEPASVTGKRKRTSDVAASSKLSVQIVTGSYERTLQGLVTDISPASHSKHEAKSTTFSTNFLFNAHASSIRCLAISPSSTANATNSSRILATGSADEKINLYQISSSAPSQTPSTSTTSPRPLAPAPPPNKELGSLLHHAATVTHLSFPSRSKLVSGALDNTIAISRTRDWNLLSSIHVPIPKTPNRPSGDTAGLNDLPTGINDIAVHPTGRLALSVGQGEGCMRLWNMITGKRAGVLTFGREVLRELGEGRYRKGEARSALWSHDGEQFAVGFERGVLVYGLDCKITGLVRVQGTKICRLRYVERLSENTNENSEVKRKYVLALSTEDGRVLFYDTRANIEGSPSEDTKDLPNGDEKNEKVPTCPLIAQLGELQRGMRIKDFAILPTSEGQQQIVITGASDGAVKIWSFASTELLDTTAMAVQKKPKLNGEAANGVGSQPTTAAVPSIGTLLGQNETHKRVTCLEAFILDAGIATSAEPVPAADSAVSVVDEDAGSEEDDFEGFGDEE